MSALNSTGRSGSGNPYTKVLSQDYLINADGQEVKRTKAQPRRVPFIRWIEKITVSETRFFEGTPCWEWQGCKTRAGYGQFKSDGRRGAKLSSPHRFAWEFFYGTIPDLHEVDHRCRNRGCASPFHIEAVTLQENRRRHAETITHCRSGHELNEENAQIVGTKRKCRICSRRRVKEFYGRNPGYEKRMKFPCRE